MIIYQPYVYVIRWTVANKGYIGVRYAKNCNPNDLFESYHTSSKAVKQLVSEVGLPDHIKIFPYPDKETALLMEEKFQRRFRVLESDYWLNLTIGGKSFCGTPITDSTRQKLSNIHKGKRISVKTREKMSQSAKKRNPSHKEKVSMSLRDKTTYTFFHKQKGYFTGSQIDFINTHLLLQPNVNRLVNGKRKKHKGWVLVSQIEQDKHSFTSVPSMDLALTRT